MQLKVVTTKPTKSNVDMVAVGVAEGKLTKAAGLTSFAKGIREWAVARAKEQGFEGKRGQTLELALPGSSSPHWLLLVGLGKGPHPVAACRELGFRAVSAVRRQSTLYIALPATTGQELQVAATSALLGTYRYDAYRTASAPRKSKLRSIQLGVIAEIPDSKQAIHRATVIADATAKARDLVNMPPNDLTPTALAETAKSWAKELGLTCKVLGKAQLQKERMELFLAVSRGSAQAPQLIHTVYAPKGAKKKVVLVGKGLTFDAGGLCIKPAKSMVDMKCDMGGAATTLGAMHAIAQLGLPIEVHAIVGAAENMTGASAYRPGDVFKARSGKTVEIINTDAEGRLVLADVLDYACELKPDVIVDHATLTGACMVALGHHTAGLFSNRSELAEQYKEAACLAGESFWQLPLDRDLRKVLDSPIADLKHCGDGYGGSITAALFLEEFVGQCPWVHNDIAGPAFLDSAHKDQPKGGTGFGVATAVAFVEQLASQEV